MKPNRFIGLSCAALMVSLAVVSCAHYAGEGSSQAIVVTTEAFTNFNGEFENTDYFRKHKPSTIAVLPFQDLENKVFSIDFGAEDPGGVVRRGMYNHIASLPFADLELYQIDRRLKNAGLNDSRDIDALIRENPRKLQSILGVNGVVTGEVTHFDRIFVGIYSQVAVGCRVKLWDLNSGRLLWSARHVSRAHAGGLSLSPVGLAMAAVASVWNLRESEMLSQTDELFREIVSTIEVPESALAAQLPAPRIDLFAVINAGKPFTAGKSASFRLVGDPGCKAYVDLGAFKAGIELRPVAPAVKQALRAEVLASVQAAYREAGHQLTPALTDAAAEALASREIYEGRYSIEPDEQAYGLMAKAYLVNAAGGQKTALDAVHYVDVDSRPPQAPRGLAADSLDGKVKLTWTPNIEEDLARYEIWSSATPLSGFAPAGRAETNELLIESLANFSRLYVRVRAVDRADNAGMFSPSAAAVALPEPGLYDLPQPGPSLEGEISRKTLLVAEKGPFMVLSDLKITAGGALYLEPGVDIRFAPGVSLTVAGGDLLAYGRREQEVRFGPQTAAGEVGSWRGLVLDGARRTALQHVVIAGAEIGLSVTNSAPIISDSQITGCSQAALHLLDDAKPSVTCSVVSDNEGQGAMVIEGQGLAPLIRNNTFENNDPFQVQSYTQLQIDLSGNYWGRAAPPADWFLGDVVWDPALTAPPDACTAKQHP